MKVEVKVPAMGESITQATIGALLKASGSPVSVDEELIELETDKVNQVLYASAAGVVTWNVAKGDIVAIDQVLGYIDTDKQAPKSVEPKKPAQSADNQGKVPSAQPQSKPEPIQTPTKAAPIPGGVGARISKEQYISELAASSASNAGIPTSAGDRPLVSPGSKHADVLRETRKPMSNIRKVIASRLVKALQETAMLTTFNEVDMSHIMALREQYKEDFQKKYQTRLGFMSFFIKASVSALKAFPEVNSYIEGDDIVYRNYFDISVAIGTDRGLVVPVVRGCDQLSFAEIESELEKFAKKAREGGLKVEDLQGGGFTVTNGGVYGSLLSTPILNMPQSAILGMHKISKRAVVVNDQIVIRPMMNLALSYDHRVIDGKEAVSFLVHIKNCLEDPSRLLIGL